MGANYTNGEGAGDDQLVQIFGLLRQLKLAIDDIRERMAGQKKSHYTIDEVARLTGRCPYTVRRWVSEGRIQATRIQGTGPRGRLLVSQEQLDRLITQGLT